MMKVKKIFIYLSFFLLVGCAKREPDIDEKIISIQETSQNGKFIIDQIGEQGSEMIINAEIFQVDDAKEGVITADLPSVSTIEQVFLNGMTMNKENYDNQNNNLPEEEIWMAENATGKYFYTIAPQFAIYSTDLEGTYDIGQKKEEDNKEYQNSQILDDSVNDIMNKLGYSVQQSFIENVGFDDTVIYYYTMFMNMPIVDPVLGVDYAHVEVIDNSIAQVAVQKNYKSNNFRKVDVITVESAIQSLKNLFKQGEMQIIPVEINKIQMMYYVKDTEFFPVWVFLADPYGKGREEAILYIDAQTGELVYDVTKG